METFKNIGRVEEIAGVFVKYGFGYLVDRFNLPLKKRHPPEEHRLSRAERLRAAFEELGPTFVKFGQLLSLRIDLLPDDVTTELKKLQDTVQPFPVKELKAAITEELGSPVEGLYGTFSEFERLGNRGYAGFIKRLSDTDIVKALRKQYNPSLWKGLIYPYASWRYKSRLIDKGCHGEDCACVWCRCGKEDIC